MIKLSSVLRPFCCRSCSYYPSVFVLQPGQFVHINKGRLHAFRKLSPSYLDQNDCHAVLRREIWRIHGLKDTEQLCVSIAWDWMFRGVTSDGANRELSSVLECAELNRRHRVQSLGIPETSLLRMARHVIALYRTSVSSPDVRGDKMIGTDYKIKRLGFVPEPLEIMKGIHPSLDVVVRGHGAALDCARRALTAQVMFSTKPNAWENPSSFPLDPYGSGFFCKFCFEELSNFYFHCDGCERLLGKDFDICMKCHNKGKHRFMVQMHLHLTNRDSTFNHTGDMSFKRRSSCPCKKGQVCQFCDFCCACSCTCHQKFTLHCRFMTMDEEFSLLHEVDDIVGSNRIKYFDETTSRLNHFRLSGDISFEHNAK